MSEEEQQLMTQEQQIEISDEDQKLVDDAVKFINEKANETVYKGSIEIGEYILKEFFDNDIEKAQSKNPTKKVSFNKLCEREDLVVHPNTLAKMVKVVCQEKFFLDEKLDTTTMSYTHKASLVKMPMDMRKITMAKQCIEECWPTRKLDEEIQKALDSLKNPQNNSLIRTTQKCIKKIENVIEIVDSSDFSYKHKELSNMDENKRDKLLQEIKTLQDKIKMTNLNEVSQKCNKLIKALEKIKNAESSDKESTATAQL